MSVKIIRETEQEIISIYKNDNMSIKDICLKFNISVTKLYACLNGKGTMIFFKGLYNE